MGMSSSEWSRYMHDELGVPMEPAEISAAVVEGLKAHYRRRVPLLPHAVETVRALAERWPLAVASSANRPLIDLVLELTGMAGLFRATVSSEEVPRGKPEPDVYIEAAGGWTSLRSGAPRSRTRPTGSARRAPPACG